MYFWLGVKNFAKIESAKIRTDGFTVLVGPNNCGKSFLMQLAQGVNAKLYEMIDEDIVQCLKADDKETCEYVITKENIVILTEKINEKLQERKEKIVRDIFKKEIAIEELYIDIVLEEDCVYEVHIQDKDKRDLANRNIKALEPYNGLITKYKEEDPDYCLGILLKKNLITEEYDLLSIHISIVEHFKVKNAIHTLFECKSLYFPASRNGLLLLYRDFFANRTDDVITSYNFENNKLVENMENHVGITQPVYEFLRFLQTYSESNNTKQYPESVKLFLFYSRPLNFGRQSVI